MVRPFHKAAQLGAALRAELDATARVSKATLPSRALIALAGSLMLAIVLGGGWALTWLATLAALEIALHRLAANCPRKGNAAGWGVLAYVGLTGAIAVAWSTNPIIFWNTGRPVLQFAGMAVLIAQLIDVQSYNFRLRYSSIVLGSAPLALLVVLPLRSSLQHPNTAAERSILAFCLACTAAYFVLAIRENRRAAGRLEASSKAARAANEAKSAFVAMISHELRTPMNGVIGLAHALKSSRSRSEQEAQIDLIIQSGNSLMLLLNDILDMSKVEAGKMQLERRPFEASALVQAISDLWEPLALEKGLRFTSRLEPNRPQWLSGDVARLRQILSNLVSNAIKFTASGEVVISITIGDAGESGLRFSAEVLDSGIGMTAPERARLFKPFSQARESTSREFGGTGLGLAISLGLVESMGGQLSVASTPGRGSTFHMQVTLPRAEAPLTSTPTLPPTLAQARVLVVDDNAINLHVARALLTALDARAVTASGGAEALALLRNESFDAVLLDVHMPTMGGVEVLNRIRAGEAGEPDTPIVAFTADAMNDEQASLLASGFDAVLSKPTVPAQLASTLSQTIAARRALNQSRDSAAPPGLLNQRGVGGSQ